MPSTQLVLRLLIALVIVLLMVVPVEASSTPYKTQITRWRTAVGGFSAWQRNGVAVGAGGTLQLDRKTARSGTDPYPAGGYNRHNFYNGGSFFVGEAISPIAPTSFGFFQAIASWNADTPTGTWIETQIRARIGTRWTKWYNVGVWAAGDSTIERHSVNLQGDADGSVSVDTLELAAKKGPAKAFQLKLRLFSVDGATSPSIRKAAVAVSTTPGKPGTLAPGNPSRWNRTLDVPECSQMVYSDGGEVWCSPTSMSMVLAYWERATGPCEPRVRAAVDGVYDWLYDGHGNWPFNTAYAATHGFEAYVTRFTSMAQAEAWIAAGVPVVISYAWKKGDLSGAPISSSNGHLAILSGFDAAGNPIVNDPAQEPDDEVRQTFMRAELERLWLEHSGGTVYLIYPQGHPVPGL